MPEEADGARLRVYHGTCGGVLPLLGCQYGFPIFAYGGITLKIYDVLMMYFWLDLIVKCCFFGKVGQKKKGLADVP